MRGTSRGRRPCQSVLVLCAYVLLRHGALVLCRSTKLRRLRGYRESNAKKPPIRKGLSERATRASTERVLSTMFENTETKGHVRQHKHQRKEDSFGRGHLQVHKPQEKIVSDVVEDGKLVAEEYQLHPKDEHYDAYMEERESGDKGGEIHIINKEEPKDLYTVGKSSKPKAKVSQPKTSAESNDLVRVGFDKRDEEVQWQEHEESQIEEKAAADIEAQHGGLKDHESNQYYVTKLQEEIPTERATEKPPKEEKSKTEETVEEDYAAKDEVEAKEDTSPLNSAQPTLSFDSPSKSESGKADSIKGEKNEEGKMGKPVSPTPPQVTEILVGFQYQLKGTRRTASRNDFADLARATSHVCDYVFRQYFMDIEEVQFLSTDKLAIYEVEAPNYVIFTIAAYFAADSSLPDQQLLTDIVTKNLLSGSTYYKYYLFLLENLEEGNAFHYASTVELYSQTSKLTGPSEKIGYQTQGSPRLFKVAFPIVVLLLVIVVAALVYITWVESQQLHNEDDELPFKESGRDNNKILTVNDGESTLPSNGGSSFTERRSFSDDSASVSESSALFVDDISRKTKQVGASPRVLYRTLNPGEFSHVDFEEVSLQGEEEKLQQLNFKLQKAVAPLKEPGEDVSKTMPTYDFMAVLNSAPFEVHQNREAGQDVEVEENPLDRLPPCNAWVKAPPRNVSEIASQLNMFPLDVPISTSQALQRTRSVENINGTGKEDNIAHLSSAMDRLNQDCHADPTFFGPKIESPTPRVALQNNSVAMQRMARLRQPVSTANTDGVKSSFDDEYEEEVLEEEAEEELSVYEEVLEEEDTSEETVGANLTWIEDRLRGTRTHEPQKTNLGISDDAWKESLMTTPSLPPRKIRDLWEQRNSTQETVRDFWEQKSKPKLNTN